MALILAWIKDKKIDSVIHDIQFLVKPEDYQELTVVNDHLVIRTRNKIALDLMDYIYDKYKDDFKSIKAQIYGNWKPDLEVEK